MEEYVRKQKPGWKNEADVIALVAHYNSLLEK
jgi:hypothetical protein